MTNSTRTLSVFYATAVATLVAFSSSTQAANMLFSDSSDIVDSFTGDGGQFLENTYADEGTETIGWLTPNAPNTFQVVDDGADAFVRRISNNPTAILAYLPYYYKESRGDVASTFATVAFEPGTDEIALGFTNGDDSAEYSFAGGYSDLWVSLNRVSGTDLANVSVWAGVDTLLAEYTGVDISNEQQIDLEIAWDPSSSQVASRVDGTDVFTGLPIGTDLSASFHDTPLQNTWVPSIQGFGFQINGSGGGKVFQFEAVPEPSTLALMSLALAASCGCLRRRRQA